VMSSDVITIGPRYHHWLRLHVLLKRKIGCLPVVESGQLVGILTEGDFVAIFARKGS
jgi:CBS domain-containing membrane protein